MSIIGLEHRPDELNLSHLRDDTGVAVSGNIPSGASPGTHHLATTVIRTSPSHFKRAGCSSLYDFVHSVDVG